MDSYVVVVVEYDQPGRLSNDLSTSAVGSLSISTM